MPMVLIPTDEERALLEPLLQLFRNDVNGKRLISTFLNSVLTYIRESKELEQHIHSIRSRIKDPDHFADKIVRKIRKCKSDGLPFDIDQGNLFTKINDLAGIRLLHLDPVLRPASLMAVLYPIGG